MNLWSAEFSVFPKNTAQQGRIVNNAEPTTSGFIFRLVNELKILCLIYCCIIFAPFIYHPLFVTLSLRSFAYEVTDVPTVFFLILFRLVTNIDSYIW